VIEEMAGSDRVPDPDDSKRAQVGNAQTTTRAKWRSSMSAYRTVLENVLDTADIVRDGDFSTVENPASLYVADSRHTSCQVPGICESS